MKFLRNAAVFFISTLAFHPSAFARCPNMSYAYNDLNGALSYLQGINGQEQTVADVSAAMDAISAGMDLYGCYNGNLVDGDDNAADLIQDAINHLGATPSVYQGYRKAGLQSAYAAQDDLAQAQATPCYLYQSGYPGPAGRVQNGLVYQNGYPGTAGFIADNQTYRNGYPGTAGFVSGNSIYLSGYPGVAGTISGTTIYQNGYPGPAAYTTGTCSVVDQSAAFILLVLVPQLAQNH